MKALALALLLSGCAYVPRVVWPHAEAPDENVVSTFVEREGELCEHAADLRLTLIGPYVVGELRDRVAYDHHTDAVFAFCLTNTKPTAMDLAWLTAELREIHRQGGEAGAVLAPLP